MMTIRDRDVATDFFMDTLGFESLMVGPPMTAKEEAQMPLGIPLNQTTSSRYRAAILYPTPSEVGRVELVEFMDLKGEDYAATCNAPNFGILSIKFPVENLNTAVEILRRRGINQPMRIHQTHLAPYGDISIFTVKSPDGANIEFFAN